ncbi:MAG: HAD-IA family hydrolase [Planctomycetes bacterium]|nr:HAD-IA family hydrolase [Planctomycetota bacterium]
MLAEIRTVVFDLDGTLTVPEIDFDGLRRSLNLPAGVSITHAIAGMQPDQQRAAMQIVQAEERRAARMAVTNPGARELVHALRERDIGTAIVTRNMLEASEIILQAIDVRIDVLITREFGPMKPAPEPVLEALRRTGGSPESALMVGDFGDDMQAGRAAGTRTCLVMNGPGPPRFAADLHVPTPSELLELFMQAWIQPAQ